MGEGIPNTVPLSTLEGFLSLCPSVTLTCQNCSRGFTNTSVFSTTTPGQLNSAGEKSPTLADWPTVLGAAQLLSLLASLPRLSVSEIIVLNTSAQASNPPNTFFLIILLSDVHFRSHNIKEQTQLS